LHFFFWIKAKFTEVGCTRNIFITKYSLRVPLEHRICNAMVIGSIKIHTGEMLG